MIQVGETGRKKNSARVRHYIPVTGRLALVVAIAWVFAYGCKTAPEEEPETGRARTEQEVEIPVLPALQSERERRPETEPLPDIPIGEGMAGALLAVVMPGTAGPDGDVTDGYGGDGESPDPLSPGPDGTIQVRQVPFELKLVFPGISDATEYRRSRFLKRITGFEVELSPVGFERPRTAGRMVPSDAHKLITDHIMPQKVVLETSQGVGSPATPTLTVSAAGLHTGVRYRARFRVVVDGRLRLSWMRGPTLFLDVPYPAIQPERPAADTMSFQWRPELRWQIRYPSGSVSASAAQSQSGSAESDSYHVELMVIRGVPQRDEVDLTEDREEGASLAEDRAEGARLPEDRAAPRRSPPPMDVQALTDTAFDTFVLDGPATWQAPDYLPGGTMMVWAARIVRSDGLVGATTPLRSYLALQDPAVVPLVTSGEPLLVETPLLGWASIPGAVRYEAEVYVRRPFEDPTFLWEGTRPEVRLQPEYIELLQTATGVPTDTFYWRVRAFNQYGGRSGWSQIVRSPYKPIAPPMDTIVAPGTVAEFVMGSSAGELDERPPVPVRVTRPFRLSRYQVTNRLAAELINMGLRRRYLEDRDNILYLRGFDMPLVGLSQLDYGTQRGLEVFRDDRGDILRVGATVGREAHPAIGISWYGAAAIANALSFADGRELAYRFAGNQVAAVPGADGYRLPTEAEWELAASRGLPQTIEETGGRASQINFYRSGDPFEDPNPPYTAAGGPTNPVGALVNASDDGIYDLLGNVWEWCADWYDPQWYDRAAEMAEEGPYVDPEGPNEPVPDRFGVIARSVRGAAWNSRRNEIRVTNRGQFPPEQLSHSVGVRLARTIVSEPEDQAGWGDQAGRAYEAEQAGRD